MYIVHAHIFFRVVVAKTSMLNGLYARTYICVSAISFLSNLVFRTASTEDKSVVLSMRKNVYNGLDYLPDYFDYFLTDPHRRCIIGEVDQKAVSKIEAY